MKKLTRITKNNISWFLPLLPDEGIGRGECAFGVIGDDGAACASIVFRKEEDALSVEWLFVHPDYRRQGIGGNLLGAMDELFAGKADSIRLSWYEELEGFSDFLLKCAFFPGEGDPVYFLNLDGLKNSSEVRRIRGMMINDMTTPIGELSLEERKKFSDYLMAETGTDRFLSQCSREFSFVLRENGTDFSGCLLTEEIEPNVFSVHLFYSQTQSLHSVSLLKSFAEKCEAQERNGVVLCLVAANPHVRSLVENIKKDGGDSVVKSQMKYAVKTIG